MSPELTEKRDQLAYLLATEDATLEDIRKLLDALIEIALLDGYMSCLKRQAAQVHDLIAAERELRGD